MPYTPTTWIDEVPAASPVKYSVTDSILGAVATDATIVPITSITAGTPLNATNMNKIETGIETAHVMIADVEAAIDQAYIDIINQYHFGTGEDGDVNISSIVSLSRNMHYNNLTITSIGELKTMGWIIYVAGTLTLESGGKITANGSAGLVSGAQGAGGGGNGNTPLPRGGNGGGGTSGAYSNKTRPYPLIIIAASLLQSGCGGAGVYDTYLAENTLYGSAGGSCSSLLNERGGGGGGGGCIHIFANTLNSNGSIEAKGGDSVGDYSTSPSVQRGGGGGGGGGFVYIAYKTLTALGIISVAGGICVGANGGGFAGGSGAYIAQQI